MNTTSPEHSPGTDHIWISQPEGHSNIYSDSSGHFTLVTEDGRDPREFMRMDAYSAAQAFIDGKFDVRGDICEAIRHYSNQRHRGVRDLMFGSLARLNHLRIRCFARNRNAARQNIGFHYDRSNEFYAQFLDSRMVYSAAYFEDAADSLEKAQTQKLERICRDLVLRPDERFLDIGCGWGGLICYASEHFGTRSVGCTLSREQLEFARSVVKRKGLEHRVGVDLCDYREAGGCYEKIASVGMFEHVGYRGLPEYFKKVYSLLDARGLFINRGVVRPQGVSDGPETFFLQKHVFPGGELVHLDDVIREGERAGFHAIGLRDLRSHYALTCRRWVENLQGNAAHCRVLVGEPIYRTWLLYLAASATSFEDGHTGAAQVLFEKR